MDATPGDLGDVSDWHFFFLFQIAGRLYSVSWRTSEGYHLRQDRMLEANSSSEILQQR